MRPMTRLFMPAMFAAVALTGCATEAPDLESCETCDVDAPSPFASVMMVQYEGDPGEGTESFKLVALMSDDNYEVPLNGDTLEVEVWASDGASNPDFRLPARLEYFEDGVGGYVSDTIDSSLLVPWQRVSVSISGQLSNGDPVDVVYHFTGEGEGVLDGIVEVRNLDSLTVIQHTSDPLTGQESFELIGEPGDSIYDSVEAGDTLNVTMWLAEVGRSFEIQASMTYEPDGIGAFVSGIIDISDFTPWQVIQIEVSGTLSDGTDILEQFKLVAGEDEAR